jgi:DNA-binding NarL/FixJ family response regulator
MRVVVAEDAMITRAGLVRLLQEAGVEVVAETQDADELLRKVSTTRPDAAIVDIRMPPTNTDEGLVAAKAIRSQHPDVAVLILSSYIEPRYAMQLLQDHPERVGYLLKERVSDVGALSDALRRIHDGECVIDPAIVSRLVARRRGPLGDLTDRERSVLALIAEGRSNRAIGDELHLSHKTVETHISQIFLKLGLRDAEGEDRRVAAVLAYLRAARPG